MKSSDFRRQSPFPGGGLRTREEELFAEDTHAWQKAALGLKPPIGHPLYCSLACDKVACKYSGWLHLERGSETQDQSRREVVPYAVSLSKSPGP